uniref:Uncharacterized protein n=1 Tax=viral metagenome TaxID=1070528 RepID=A0A6C0JDZ3_9ZZZZ
MGVPSFFRWLQLKYPSVIEQCKSGNPTKFDNLYIDLNGIIHPCSHPEGQPPPESENEIMDAICKSIDKLVNIVRPRKLIYLAIDGVAPRAKMNQQRARRFRTSKLAKEKLEDISHIKSKLKKKGIIINTQKKYQFDSNSITPGTIFMDRLSKNMQKYIKSRLQHHRLWKNVIVILSDSSVPGEGEHKIVQFIRDQKSKKNYNPDIHHVLYGADADLIMLGLSTHEKLFTIIREEFNPDRIAYCEICNQAGHKLNNCVGVRDKTNKNYKPSEVKYLWVKLYILRKYLKNELHINNISFDYKFERSLDDWIFLCFFVGNDFLPHLPSLSIQEGAIDMLVDIYKRDIKQNNEYLTNNGKANTKQIKSIMCELGKKEDDIFKQRFFKSKNEHDIIQFHKKNYQNRYYLEKFNDQSLKLRTNVVDHYINGLCWVLKYYFKGCPSWNWYFPYHYAPFASDFSYAKRVRCNFNKNTVPFKPFEQLVSTLPPAGSHLLPKVIGDLMINPNSPIIDYYPNNFKIDLNGKKYEWQGVTLLPFIDEERVKQALQNVDSLLTESEIKRNISGTEIIYTF